MTINLANVETPSLVIEESVALSNIHKFQVHCNQVGLHFRPHIKTHKTIYFARAQIKAGAVGINCQKIGEAEIMAKHGFNNILITFNIIGNEKLSRLRRLAGYVDSLSVVADNHIVVEGLASAFADAPNPLTVFVECDTGAGRCGTQTSDSAVNLASTIHKASGLQLGGLLTYPPVGGQRQVVDFMTSTRDKLNQNKIPCLVISTGGSPDMWHADNAGIITEYRAGTYIFNDRSLVERGTCKLDDCAGRVLATIVSRPTKTRAIIDAGSKSLTSDLLGLDGFGHIVGHPEIQLVALHEEHGILNVGEDSSLAVGDRIQIIPNHICVVSNLFETAWLLKENSQLHRLDIAARGLVT